MSLETSLMTHPISMLNANADPQLCIFKIKNQVLFDCPDHEDVRI